jgi:guanine deaminase
LRGAERQRRHLRATRHRSHGRLHRRRASRSIRGARPAVGRRVRTRGVFRPVHDPGERAGREHFRIDATTTIDLRGKVVRGTLFDAPSRDRIRCLTDALVAIDEGGTIASVYPAGAPEYERCRRDAERAGVLVALPGVVLPGFVDTHVHAPQYPQLGKALDAPLEVWLQRYTFPLEARYRDLAFASRVYETLVADLLANGTTTALYFATVDLEPTQRLADICADLGQRALIGKVAMDNPDECPDDYRDASAAAGIEATRGLIDYIGGLDRPAGTLGAVVTPRFTPSCTDELLRGLGVIARETGCHVQTHCSESDWAHGYAQHRFGCSDVRALDAFGLLGRRTVLAHGNLMSDDDLDRLVERGASVAHCPYSNFYFANAVFPLRRALAKGLRVGLGTDISGGPSASMFESMRLAVVAARALESGVDATLEQGVRGRPDSRISVAAAFHLATAGGGEALDLRVGRFAPGYAFDAIAIDPDARDGTIRLWDEDDDELVLQTILLTASCANVAAVWTNGTPAGRIAIL